MFTGSAVHIVVRNRAHLALVDWIQQDSAAAQARADFSRRTPGLADVEHDDVGGYFLRLGLASRTTCQSLREELRVAVIVEQAARALLQRDHACGGEHAHLPHPSAQPLAVEAA